MTIFFKSRQRGMTLVEMLVYVFLLTLTVFVIINSLFSLSRSYRSLESTLAIETTAQVALERLVREVRGSSSIAVAESVWDSSPGKLLLNQKDGDDNPLTVRFLVANERIEIEENGFNLGPLTPASVRVTNLVFRRITTLESEALKIEMTVESGEGTSFRSKNFYSTVVLRGSYLP
ncbi:MAG: prepilin-type N-terminal cleavage/methylation domain-containing protein [Parcubacteria group bacterium]